MIFRLFWYNVGKFVGSCWEHFGVILGLFWDYFGMMDHFGTVLLAISQLFIAFPMYFLRFHMCLLFFQCFLRRLENATSAVAGIQAFVGLFVVIHAAVMAETLPVALEAPLHCLFSLSHTCTSLRQIGYGRVDSGIGQA